MKFHVWFFVSCVALFSASVGAERIVVNFSEANLTLYADTGETLVVFPVILPKKEPMLPVEGEVRGVDLNPVWYPTVQTRAAYLKQKNIVLPARIPPGNARNAMGAIKIILLFSSGNIDPALRIHGTIHPELLELPPSKRHLSRGCIRLKNEHARTVASLIEGKPTKVIFEK